MKLSAVIDFTSQNEVLGDIIKMRREKFRYDIRKERNNQIFKQKRSNVQQISTQVKVDLDIYIQDFRQSLLDNENEKINELLLIYEKLSYSQMEQFYIECIKGELISLIIQNFSTKHLQNRTNLCHLLTIIFSYISQYEDVLIKKFYAQFFSNIQTFNKQIAEIILHKDSQLREQGLQLLQLAVMENPDIGDEFLNPDNLLVVIQSVQYESLFFKDIREVIHVLIPQLATYSWDMMEPIITILDRYLYIEDKELQVGVIRTLKRLLNKQKDEESQCFLAKRYFELQNFHTLIPKFKTTCFYGIIIEFLLTTYGSVESYIVFSQENSHLKIFSFTELLDFINHIITSFTDISFLAYWALSNLIYSIESIQAFLEHPKLIDNIFKNAYSESLNSKCEISHLFKNMTRFINYFTAGGILMKKGICDIIYEYLQIPQLQKPICQVLQNLITLQRRLEISNINDELAYPLNQLQYNLFVLKIDDIFQTLHQDIQKEYDLIEDYLSNFI